LGEKKENKNQIKDNADEELDSFIGPGAYFHSTRHAVEPEEDPWIKNPPRLGRRESEPHSIEITRIYDILNTNFKNGRTTWDLHHYFTLGDKKIDIQFDVSYFKNLKIDYTLTSYRAEKYNNRIPDLAINILSKNTYLKDFSIHLEQIELLKIPVYIIFSSFNFNIDLYKPPFLRAYILEKSGDYKLRTLKEVSIDESGNLIKQNLIDLRPHLSFMVGIKRSNLKHETNTYNYDMIILDAETLKPYKTSEEILREKWEQERKKREEAEKETMEERKKREEAEKKLMEERKKREEAEKEIKKLQKLINEYKHK
ncbi:MAG: hypothetical protein ACTSRZ_18320, partial [Promethearchaeota archaeon]